MISASTTNPPERLTSFIDWMEYIREELKVLREKLNN